MIFSSKLPHASHWSLAISWKCNWSHHIIYKKAWNQERMQEPRQCGTPFESKILVGLLVSKNVTQGSTDSPSVPPVALDCQAALFKFHIWRNEHIKVVSLGEINIHTQLRAKHMLLCTSVKFKLQIKLSRQTQHKRQQLSTVMGIRIQVLWPHSTTVLNQSASWRHLSPNKRRVAECEWFLTTTGNSRHVGWVKLLLMSHWVELRASWRRNRRE